MTRALFILCVVACAPATTKQRINYPSGSPHYEYEMRAGVPHGTGRVWHTNGQPKSEGEYVNGVKHGKFTFYDDDGRFERQTFFWKNVEVWRSSDPMDNPPTELVQGLMAYSGTEPRLGEVEQQEEVVSGFRISTEAPAPFFATLDRTTGLNRAGLQFGFGSTSPMGFGSVTRLEVFGNYRFSNFGAYGQLSQAALEAGAGTQLSGRRTLEAGGTYHHTLQGVGELTPRLGVVVPVGNDDTEGYVASSAGSLQRPTDAVTSFPATVAVRSGASVTRGHHRFVLQADGGIDWLFGGRSASVDALVRANGGIGLGIRSALLTIELSNTLRVSEPSRSLHAIGIAGTFWINRMWTVIGGSQSFDGHTAVTLGVGYEL